VGLIRIYLAICVVAAHSGKILPWPIHFGREAVQIFYLISGFYMALVLSTKYEDVRAFYLSRFLRIYPVYWLVLIVAVFASLASGMLFHNWLSLEAYFTDPLKHNGIVGILFAMVTNVTVIGQDWLLFLNHNAGSGFEFTSAFRNGAFPLWRYLVIPQAWSVGIELSFYLLAPFLNRLSTGLLILIIAFSLGCRFAVAWGLGWVDDPWNYRFFPFELAIFGMGMLSFRFFRILKSRIEVPIFFSRNICMLFMGPLILVGMLLVAHIENMVFPEMQWWAWRVLICMPIFGISIAFIFLLFKDNRADRWIGELSYAVYLVHYIIAQGIAAICGAGFLGKEYIGPVSVLVSVLFAISLEVFVITKVDRLRHAIAGRK